MPVLVNFQEEQSTRSNALGLRSAKTASATTRFEPQIWDAQSGRIVWEGLSDLPVAEELIREHLVSFAEIIQGGRLTQKAERCSPRSVTYPI